MASLRRDARRRAIQQAAIKRQVAAWTLEEEFRREDKLLEELAEMKRKEANAVTDQVTEMGRVESNAVTDQVTEPEQEIVTFCGRTLVVKKAPKVEKFAIVKGQVVRRN